MESVVNNPDFGQESPQPAPARQPIVNLPPVVWVVVALLFAIHALISIGGEPWRAWTNYLFAFIPARFGTAAFAQVPGSAVWSMLTYGFLHGSWAHVSLNCLWLVVFSKPVEARLGTPRYLILLALSIIGGALASLIVHWGEVLIMVGISGGVSGILAAAIPLMNGRYDELHDTLRPLRPAELLRNPRALTFTLMWLGLTLATASSQYLSTSAFDNQTQVAWDAHLGGFVVGLIGFYILDATIRRKPVHTLH